MYVGDKKCTILVRQHYKDSNNIHFKLRQVGMEDVDQGDGKTTGKHSWWQWWTFSVKYLLAALHKKVMNYENSLIYQRKVRIKNTKKQNEPYDSILRSLFQFSMCCLSAD